EPGADQLAEGHAGHPRPVAQSEGVEDHFAIAAACAHAAQTVEERGGETFLGSPVESAHRIGAMSILVVGEALIDIVSTPGSSNRYAPGGAPANIALGLGRLGDEVEFLTDIGDDFHGGFLLAHLRESRVEVLARPSGRTSTALARLAADGSADYDF